MKILAICNGGNCRSVTLASMLKQDDKSVEVIPAGVRTSSQETIRMLADWADKVVVVADGPIIEKFPKGYENKIIHLNIGKDKWVQAMHPKLVRIIKKALLNSELKDLKVREVLKAS